MNVLANHELSSRHGQVGGIPQGVAPGIAEGIAEDIHAILVVIEMYFRKMLSTLFGNRAMAQLHHQEARPCPH